MVLWREPIPRALGECLRAHDAVADERQAIKVQHEAERTLDIPAQRVVLRRHVAVQLPLAQVPQQLTQKNTDLFLGDVVVKKQIVEA